jgi:superfamily II DNA or RNA helicase
MIKQYISDIITDEDVQNKWSPGSRILITAQTGSGKSEFIKNILYKHCTNTRQKVLLLSNRILLKEQVQEDLKNKKNSEIITVLNYQYLETRILSGGALADLFSQYDYIVYDEAHYIFSDSQFNRNTDLLIQPIKTTPKDKVFLFLTATPQALYDYQAEYDYVYEVPIDYSYIDKLYFFSSEDIPESIFQNIPFDEKGIYFSSNAKESLELSRKFTNASFFCSESNWLADLSDKQVLDQIVKNAKFKDQFLFTTKVLDNGINLKDPDLKHIVLDFTDIITLIQCLGRKRILSSQDKINVYIRSYHDGNLKYILRGINKKIDLVKERQSMTEDEFKDKYRKKDFDDVIDNDFRINEAKYQHYKTQARLIKQMIYQQEYRAKEQGVDKKNLPLNSYENYIRNLLHIDKEKILNGNEEFEKVSLETLLRNNVGKKMFKKEQKQFVYQFFNKVFSPKKTDYRKRGIRSIRAILQEDRLPYTIISDRDWSSKNRGKTYWYIIYIEKDKNG